MGLAADSGGGGVSSCDTVALRRVASSIDGVVSGPLRTALSDFMDAMTGIDNCMLETDTALDRMLPPWENLLNDYQTALGSFAVDLRKVAANFDKAGNSRDLFATPTGR